MTEMGQGFVSRGYWPQGEEAVLANLIGSNEELIFCDSYPKKVVEFEKSIQNIWDLIQAYGILDLEEFKTYLFELEKAVATFSRFGHGNLHVDRELREAFGIVFGNNVDLQTRIETVYKGFQNWQTRWSDDESAEMLQVLLSAIIDELKPLAKSYGDFVEAVRQIMKSRMSRQRRSIIVHQATAFMHDDILQFIGDMTIEQRFENFENSELDAKLTETNDRFEDIFGNIQIAAADVIDFWYMENYPMVRFYLRSFQFENVLDEVQKVIVSTEFKTLLENILEFPRAIWEEFDIDEFVEMNRLAWAKFCYELNIDTSASNSQNLMIEGHGLPIVYES